jgi:hypothetical protein
MRKRGQLWGQLDNLKTVERLFSMLSKHCCIDACPPFLRITMFQKVSEA